MINGKWRKLPVLFAAVLLAGNCAFAKTVVLYHTGDVHGWYAARPARWDIKNASRMIGGFAALAAKAGQEKDKVIFLDSGDIFQGTPEGNLTRGQASITLMNLLGYSALALGNHEFDYGQEPLKKALAQAKFPALSCNMYLRADGTRVPYVKPYTVLDVGGAKIGVIGATIEETAVATMPANVEDIEFRNRAEEVKKAVAELKKQGVENIIVLTHGGVCGKCTGRLVDSQDIKFSEWDETEGNLSIARACRGAIALVLGGHTHAGLKNGYYDAVSGTWFAEGYNYLSYVDRIELDIDDNTGRMKVSKVELEPLWAEKEDGKVLAALKPIQDSIALEMDRPIGETKDNLVSLGVRFDSPLGNWSADAIRDAGNAEIGFHNSHGIRADIMAGTITYRSVYQAFPFENTLVTMELTGEQIARVMKDNLSHVGSGMQVSGLTVVYSTDERGNVDELVLDVNGSPLRPGAVYRVATNNYLAGGGSGGMVFKEGRNMVDTGISIRDYIIDRIKKETPVSEPESGRIRRVD
ncbi:MAG: bifunctional UDP-sugar hydrolase/5'-nucleotidase [Elusimicrobiaceae bacterium]|nr:bifunctional UDP-sugar hydrolase/5'-nucleotidase [Elusimicrobiaceae bacterium]